MDRPNYFDLLGLDPDASYEDIQKAIGERNNRWSRPHPTRGTEFEQNRQRLPHIRQVMDDPELRRQEAEDCRRRSRGATDDALTVAENDLRVIAPDGALTASELDKLANLPQYRGILSRDDLLRIAGDLNIRITTEAPEDSGAPPKPRLDPATETRIRDGLNFLGKSSLYDFLGLASNSQRSVLQRKASEILQGYRNTQVRPPELNIAGRLAGDCLNLFDSAEHRARYDESLRMAPLEEVLREAETLGGIRSQITSDFVVRLLDLARQKGVDEEEARRAITRLGQQRGWPVYLPGALVVVEPPLLLQSRAGPVVSDSPGYVGEKLCARCDTPVLKLHAERRLELGYGWINCPICEQRISLLDGPDKVAADQISETMRIRQDATPLMGVETADSVVSRKERTGQFDVFLCHNNEDKEAVKDIGRQLRQNDILPWLDEWELRPFEPWQPALEKVISRVDSVAIFVGPSGIGPWENVEIRAFIEEFARRKIRMGLVLLPGCPETPQVPIMLRSFNWVDFRRSQPNPLEHLIWGITGERRTNDRA